jgi:hypothetical protein
MLVQLQPQVVVVLGLSAAQLLERLTASSFSSKGGLSDPSVNATPGVWLQNLFGSIIMVVARTCYYFNSGLIN